MNHVVVVVDDDDDDDDDDDVISKEMSPTAPTNMTFYGYPTVFAKTHRREKHTQ